MSNNSNISKELWFPGMGANFIKYWKVYRLITGKQYQKALIRNSRCFQWVKIALFKFRKVVVLHKLEWIIIRSVHQRMPPTKEVVKSINSNFFNITYKFDWHPSTFKSLVNNNYSELEYIFTSQYIYKLQRSCIIFNIKSCIMSVTQNMFMNQKKFLQKKPRYVYYIKS